MSFYFSHHVARAFPPSIREVGGIIIGESFDIGFIVSVIKTGVSSVDVFDIYTVDEKFAVRIYGSNAMLDRPDGTKELWEVWARCPSPTLPNFCDSSVFLGYAEFLRTPELPDESEASFDVKARVLRDLMSLALAHHFKYKDMLVSRVVRVRTNDGKVPLIYTMKMDRADVMYYFSERTIETDAIRDWRLGLTIPIVKENKQ